MSMNAVVLEEFQEPLEVHRVDRPEPEPDGLVAKVEGCGVCRSDWHCWQGDWDWFGYRPDPPHVLGHEPTGTVVEVGENVENVSEGQEIAIPFNFACGKCSLCRNGRENICENHVGLGFMNEAPGAFAEEVHVPNADVNAVPLPDSIDAETAAGCGCRFMTSYHGMAHQGDVGRGESVVVHGCGGIGLSAVHIADTLGANVVAVDLTDEKLESARDLGAVETVNAEEVDDVPAEVKAIADGGADVSMDALGIATTCQNSVGSLGTRGQHIQVGLTTEEEQGMVHLPTDTMVMQEIEFIGSFGMPPTRYDEIFRMVATGKLEPEAVVSGTIGLEDVNDTLEAMTDYGTEGIPVIDEF